LKPFFRRETLAKRPDNALGDALIPKPLSFRILAFFVVLISAAVLMFLIWGQYTRKQTVEGYLLPDKGSLKIYAPACGVVTKRAVGAGQKVHKGDVLFIDAPQLAGDARCRFLFACGYARSGRPPADSDTLRGAVLPGRTS
jgi:hypothetical protein